MQDFGSIAPSIFILIKIAVWIFLFTYVLFSGVVIKQVRVMTQTLEVGFEKPIKLIALVHFIVSLTVFILALIIL